MDPIFDFASLSRQDAGLWGRSKRAALWLLGLLLFLAAAVITLVLYLQTFEAEDAQRRRITNTQWLEQTVRFHFRRLEDDLGVLAQNVRESEAQIPPDRPINAGLLMRQKGVVLVHGWVAAGTAQPALPVLQRLYQDSTVDPGNADALAVMQDIATNLRRPSYAGPIRSSHQSHSFTVWLAVPLFERGVFLGSYLAAISLDQAVATLIPAWFLQDHHIEIVDDQQIGVSKQPSTASYRAFLELPGADVSLQIKDIQSDSSMVPRLFFGVALLCLTGMLASLYALQSDFAKRQRTEMLLQAQVALRSAMENAVTVGLRAWDRQGRVLYVNKAFCTMVGFDPQDLIGQKAPLPYWPQTHMDELQAIHKGLMAKGTERAGVETQFQHKNGHLIDVLIHEAPLYDSAGNPIGWMSSIIDVSERKRAERMAARQQQKLDASGRLVAMGEVASTLAHELNQPLGALSGFANGLLNRLRNGRLSDEALMSVVERMEQLAAKAGRIIQRVNAFARRREMVWERIEVRDFLRQCIAPLQKQRFMPIRLHLPPAPVWIQADVLLLEHAIVNLISNAEHWSRQGERDPAIEVVLHADADQVILAVHDSGPGVPQEQYDQVFNAFFTAKEDGMGMGLAICRSVIEAHHGHIDVGSSDVLQGACFTIRLPMATVVA